MTAWILGVWLLTGHPPGTYSQILQHHAAYPSEGACVRVLNGPRYRGGARRQIRGRDWVAVECRSGPAAHLAYDAQVARRSDPGRGWRSYR
jgi:hypothetical protein